MTKYCVCMTCFNEVAKFRDSLSSILGQLNDDYEVIVVDNFSTDGTYEVLREFELSRKIKVIQKRSWRGLGRQFAFENSSGEYVLANLDLDDLFLPVLVEIVTWYHKKAEGNLLAVFNSSWPDYGEEHHSWVQNLTIGPRELIASIGGWRDLNWFEDWDIWSRANNAHKYCWTSFRFAENEPLHNEQSTRLRERHERYRDMLRLGQGWDGDPPRSLSRLLAYTTAKLSLLSHNVLVGQDPKFNSLNPKFHMDFATGDRR